MPCQAGPGACAFSLSLTCDTGLVQKGRGRKPEEYSVVKPFSQTHRLMCLPGVSPGETSALCRKASQSERLGPVALQSEKFQKPELPVVSDQILLHPNGFQVQTIQFSFK